MSDERDAREGRPKYTLYTADEISTMAKALHSHIDWVQLSAEQRAELASVLDVDVGTLWGWDDLMGACKSALTAECHSFYITLELV